MVYYHPISSPTPDTIIGWLWRIVKNGRCSFHCLLRNFSSIPYAVQSNVFSDNFHVEILHRRPFLQTRWFTSISHLTCSPSWSKLRGCLPNSYTIIDYGGVSLPPFTFLDYGGVYITLSRFQITCVWKDYIFHHINYPQYTIYTMRSTKWT